MKKRVIWEIIAALLLQCVTFGTYVFADEIPITIWINGEKVESEVDPVTENDRTLVPLRAIFEAMGAEVSWDDASQTAKVAADGITIQVVIDDVVMKKNGEDVILDVPARLINDRTMVPVRAISEGIGADVDWNEEEQKVLITYQKQTDVREEEPKEEDAKEEKPAVGERVTNENLEGYTVVWYEDVDIIEMMVRNNKEEKVMVEVKDKNGKLIGKAINPSTGKTIDIAVLVYNADGVNVTLIDEDKVRLEELSLQMKVNFLMQYYFDLKENQATVLQAVKTNKQAVNDFVAESWDYTFVSAASFIQKSSDYKYLVSVEGKKELLAYFKGIQEEMGMEAGQKLEVETGELDAAHQMILVKFKENNREASEIRYVLSVFDKEGNMRCFFLQNLGNDYGIREINDEFLLNYYYCPDDEQAFKDTVRDIIKNNVQPASKMRYSSSLDKTKEE